MSERRRKYYGPRVLLDLADVVGSTFPDSLVCLTGQDFSMLRSLLEYLGRRSTWVSEYQEGFYLVPDDTEWDTVQAMVADLEEKLMGCTELEATLEAILAAAQCICANTQGSRGTPVSDGMYDNYVSDQTLDYPDPYPDDTEGVDAARCGIAVLTYEMCYEILTEVVQPAQQATQDILLPAVLGLIVAAIGTPVALLPAGLVYEAINSLIDAWVEGQLENVVNELVANKEDLVCAVYEALDGGTYRDAEAAAWVVIDAMTGISIIDKLVFKAMFAPWDFRAVKIAYDNETAWALARLDPGLCATCGEYGATFEVEWSFPPCPGEWTGTYACWNGRLCGNDTIQPFSSLWWNVGEAGTRDMVIEADFQSCWGFGWGVGDLTCYFRTGEGQPWFAKALHEVQTEEDAGQVNYKVVETEDVNIEIGQYMLRYSGPAFQPQTEPYPFEAMRLKVWTKLPD